MKKQVILIMVLASLLSITACIKDHHKPTTEATVTTFAGSGQVGAANGTGTAASFATPNRIAIDASGFFYVLDYQLGTMRKISPKAEVTTLLGVELVHPLGVAVDAAGFIYTGDFSYTINKISPDVSSIRTFAGNGSKGSADGPFYAATFNGTKDMAFDAAGNLLLSDSGNNKIRKITPAGIVSTLAGSGAQGAGDGQGTVATFNRPDGIAVDASGNVFVADTYNNLIRKITPAGVVTTLAGSGAQGSNDGKGSAASFYHPAGMGIDALGNVYVADYGNNKIRRVTQQGEVTTVAGSGTAGFSNGPAASASFKGPTDVLIDEAGNIYVTDSQNHVIRKIVITDR